MDTGFTVSLGTLKDLRILNVLYADGRTILLEHNNTINFGDQIEDSLQSHIQLEDNGIIVDTIPKNNITMQRTVKLYYSHIVQLYLLSTMVYCHISQSGAQHQMKYIVARAFS